MAKVFRQVAFDTGDVVTPHELNQELSAIAAELNGGLDRDNITRYLLETEKVALDTWHEIGWVEAAGPDTVSRDGYITDWYPIPIGALLQPRTKFDITTGDGRLQIEGQMHAYATAAGPVTVPIAADLGIFIDGELVARSGCNFSGGDDAADSGTTLACFGAPPVGAGTHTVELKVQFRDGNQDDLEVLCRCLWARYVRR